MVVLVPQGEQMEISAISKDLVLDEKELAVADWSFRNRREAGVGTETLSSAKLLYLSASHLGLFPWCTGSQAGEHVRVSFSP